MPKIITKSKSAQRRRLEAISAYELGRPRARMGNPNTGIGEVVVTPQYDIYFAAQNQALTLLTLFSLQQGATYNFMGVTAFAKGLGHTTLTQAGMLSSSYTYVIRGLSVTTTGLQGTAGFLRYEDANNFLGSYGELDVNAKPYWWGILSWLPAGGGIVQSGVGSLTAPQSSCSSNNGNPQSKNIYPLPGGIMINPQENFGFVINPTINAGGAPSMLATVAPTSANPANGLSAWVRFDGTLIRVA